MRKLSTEEKKAQETINLAISDYRTGLEAITLVDEEDLDPIMVEGETSTGYSCQLMTSPKRVAAIVLKYDYPVFAVLEEEPPQAMWDELAREFGLEHVLWVDL